MARTDPKKAGKRMAMCGLLSALALVFMILFSVIGVGAYAGPFVASLVLIPIVDEYDVRTALISYAAIAALGLLIMPDRELAVVFLCYGWYPIAETFINCIDSKPLQLLVKLIVYALMLGAVYAILSFVMGINEIDSPELLYGYGAMAFAGYFIFLYFSKAFAAVRYQWHARWKKRIMR